MSSSEPDAPDAPNGFDDARLSALATELNSVAIHLVRRLRRQDEALEVTAARLSALSVLVFGGPHSLGELASDEHVTPSTMSRVVDGLEAGGLAERRADRGDGRVVWVHATAKGRRLMYRGRDRRVGSLVDELRELSPDDLVALERAAATLRGLEGPEDGDVPEEPAG
ncbi:MAG: MarR family transcriptional regulator [Dehalococcoidia bacterium]|jgi:DNA-binding MarR family transcriptional regulator|nr:MarR family transcriptional regulator [Dehalococcoidia bacterium]